MIGKSAIAYCCLFLKEKVGKIKTEGSVSISVSAKHSISVGH